MSFIPHMPCERCKELESRLDLALAQRDEYQSRLQDAAVDSLKLSKTHNAELIARLDRIRTVIHDHDMWPESKFMAICSVMGEDAYLKEEYGIEPGRPCEHIDDEGGKCLKCGWIQPGVVEKRCPICNGDDKQMPCAYPSEFPKGCLRVKV